MVSTLHCRATDFQNLSILQNCNSIPIKQWLPVFPSPSPRQPLFYLLSVPLWTWLLCEPHKSEIMEYLSCCDWLISLSMMSSWLVHVVTCAISFLFKAEWSSIVCMDHILFILLSVVGHLDCFHLFAVVKCCCEHRGVNTFQDPAFKSFGYITGREIAASYNYQRIF